MPHEQQMKRYGQTTMIHKIDDSILQTLPLTPRITLLLILLLSLFFPSSQWVAHAQLDQGTITGTVTDPEGGVVPNADVVLERPDTGFTLSTKTDSGGSYVFSPIKIGTYLVKVTASGFASTTETGLTLHVNERLGANVKLAIGNVTVNVVVTASQAPFCKLTTRPLVCRSEAKC